MIPLAVKGWFWLIAAACPALLFAQVLEFRTWRDAAGAELVADFVGEVGDEVWLYRQDGALLTVRPAELSREDQRYVLELREVASANARAGLPPPRWQIDAADRFAMRTLRALAEARVPPVDTAEMTLGEALDALAQAVRRQTEGGWDFTITAPETLRAQPLRIALSEVPVYAAIEALARAHRFSFTIAGTFVRLDPTEPRR